MILYSEIQLGSTHPCPYLPGKTAQFAWFLADKVSDNEINDLLADGWRKFGIYFFQPHCPACQSCIPVRIRANELQLTRNTRRLVRKNSDLKVDFCESRYSEELYLLYEKHSRMRFDQTSSREEFLQNFFTHPCKAIMSKYLINDTLIGAGFLDVASKGLSSVYFVYDPVFMNRGLGIYSIIRETLYAQSIALEYYYLGYFVEGNSTMEYKARFSKHERYDWNQKIWRLSNEYQDS